MSLRTPYKLTIDQTSEGGNNNTASREGGRGPIIDSNGWFWLPPGYRRFDILLTASSVSSGFSVQAYAKTIDGDELAIGDAVSFTANGTNSIFQDTEAGTYSAVKIKMASRTDGTLNAEIHVS
jgi:hypothetical protein